MQARIYEFDTAVTYIEGKKGILNGSDRSGIEIGCSVEFGGKKEYWSPQHLFVGAIETCIMTTFLWLLAKKNMNIMSYHSTCTGKAQLMKGEFIFTEITVKPIITIESNGIKAAIQDLIAEAGEQCMISRSVECPVNIQPSIEIRSKEEK